MKINILLITYRRSNFISSIIDKLSSKNINIYIYSNGWDSKKIKFDVIKTRSLIEKKKLEGKVFKTFFNNNYLPVEQSIPFAVDWFYKEVEKGIILEDDCIPNTNSFKTFKEVLNQVKTGQLVHVNLNNKIVRHKKVVNEFRFDEVKLLNVWGWASNAYTWETTNRFNKISILTYLKCFRGTGISRGYALIYYILYIFSYFGLIKTWDFIYAIKLICSGVKILQIYPSLVTNDGADEFASNHSFNHELPRNYLKPPLGFEYDKYLLNTLYSKMLFKINLKRINKVLKNFLYKFKKLKKCL